jgi:2-aminoadipate transaminase
MAKTPRSFIREILKVTENPGIISFAGGLPNPEMIDTEGIAQAARNVLSGEGKRALQYSTTEGDATLRAFIAERYRKRYGIPASADEILITNGSQQSLDLIGKILIDPGDTVVIERPGYLGAIQSFAQYEPRFCPVPLHDDGLDCEALWQATENGPVRLAYGIPNSQNPSGVTYTEGRRKEIARILEESGTLFIEDDAYGELNFSGRAFPPVRSYLPDLTVMTGSFSKILAPGMRLGWVYAPRPVMDQLVTVKQASDLHSNYLSQRIAARYLSDTDIDAHIRKIREAYRQQCACMLEMVGSEFPEDVRSTKPEGGMFLWLTLPERCRSMDVYEKALVHQVAVLPGIPFYVDGGGNDTLRLNFSNSGEEQIQTGMRRLGAVIAALSGP